MLPGSPSLAALFRDHGNRWEIEKITRGSEWVAVLPDADTIRIVTANDLGTLRFRIEQAEREEEEAERAEPGP